MIPKTLTIQGLYSYQQKQTIDFTRLTEAHLFGVFGSVGSGKSSILDAISFALYGETERLNLKDNRNYNMMNLKSSELYIEFIFEDGKDNVEYQAIVKGKRNSKRFEDVKKLDRTAYRKNGAGWEPIELLELQSVIGLSYENFKRTVIIPQGKFQEFLQLGNKDRTQMMKELFNLGKFELYYKVASLESRNNEKKQNLEGQLQQLGEVKPEQIEEAQKRFEEIKKEIAELTTKLESKQKEEQGFNQLKELFAKLKSHQDKSVHLKQQEEEFKKLEQSIKEYEYCMLHFKSLFEGFAEVEKKVADLSRLIDKDKVTLEAYDKQLIKLEDEFEKLKKEYAQRDSLKQKAEELQKIVRLIELNTENKVIDGRIKKGQEFYQNTEKQVKQIKSDKEQADKALKTQKKQLPDLSVLSKVRNWHTVNKSLKENQLGVTKDLEALRKEIKDTEAKALEVRSNTCFEGISPEVNTPEAIELLTQKTVAHKQQIAAIDKKIEHLNVQVKLEEYASGLADGKPCPLCGALSHPDILNAQDVAAALQKERSRKVKQEEAIALVEKSIEKLKEVNTQISYKKEQEGKLLIKQKEHNTKLEEHLKYFKWEEYKEEQVLNKAFSDAENIQKAIKEQEEKLEQLNVTFEKESGNLERYKRTLDEIKQQQIVNQTEIQTLSGQITTLNMEEYINQTSEQVKQLSDTHLKRYGKLEIAFNKMNADIAHQQKAKSEASGRLEANRKVLEQEKETKLKIENRIREQLEKSEYITSDEVKAILKHELDLESSKKRVADYKQEMQVLNEQTAQLQKEIGDRKYNPEDHQKSKVEVQQLTEASKLKNQKLGKTEGEIKKLKADIEQQKELQKQLDAVELRGEDIKTMKQLFKASGFVNYVSSVHLHNLCNAANERFYKLTRQKLSLEITDDNNFLVRDFMNGGKVRSVKTLSGGQTFQASLSLALALSDSIQKFTESSQNFFFLDEGFGSLDKEALDVVLETLKSLRKENRVVGVISHVEEMQQEIDVYVKVKNDPEIGSVLDFSWKS